VTEEQPNPGRRQGRHPKEFRQDVAALVSDQRRTIVDVAKELGLVKPVGRWPGQSGRGGSARMAGNDTCIEAATSR